MESEVVLGSGVIDTGQSIINLGMYVILTLGVVAGILLIVTVSKLIIANRKKDLLAIKKWKRWLIVLLTSILVLAFSWLMIIFQPYHTGGTNITVEK